MKNENYLQKAEFLLFQSQTDNEDIKVHVIVKDETIWLSQKGLAELFEVDRSVISRHLKNIFDERELVAEVVCANFAHTTLHGAMDGRTQTQNVTFYNLDAIISVGYRVNSRRATQFRIWATGVLKEYMRKGFALDDDRLKQGKTLFGKDYFRELLERVRSIRSSERRIWQQITDIFAECSIDYDKDSSVTRDFSWYRTSSTMPSRGGQRRRSLCLEPITPRSTWGWKRGSTHRMDEF